MKIEIPYGKTKQTLEISEDRVRAVISPRKPEAESRTQEQIVRDALEHPIGSLRLGELAKDKEKILVITSDHTRPLPSHITLPLYLAEIRAGNPAADITILIATGMHRPPTMEEMRAKFGAETVEKERFVIHNAKDDENMVLFGTLPSGGELWLNRLVKEADLVVSEGFIEPHFFAGFSGGRKSILPGAAGKRTVLYNHNAGFIQDPLARQGILEGNPIHRDMAFAAEQAGLAFILNVLLDEDKRIVAAVAGDSVKAHEKGCQMCLEMTQVPGVGADIAVTSNGGYPLDQNVYQSVKGLTAAEVCVREGGVIVICAALGDGHGGKDFFHWFADRENPQEVTRDIENIPAGNTLMDRWQAQILARVMEKASVIFVTGPENKELIEAMHMGWAEDVNAAIKKADTMLRNASASVTVIPDGVGVIVQKPVD